MPQRNRLDPAWRWILVTVALAATGAGIAVWEVTV